MRLKHLCLCLASLPLWGCDAGGLRVEAINSQSKVIQCTLNGSPLKLEIIKGSLDANLFLSNKEIKVNLLEVKDFYQMLMRFDPNIGQLKINKAGTELIQLREAQERIEACSIQLKS
jgi:ABC-type ATPase with predicted acetyltransferase domain